MVKRKINPSYFRAALYGTLLLIVIAYVIWTAKGC